MRTTTDLLPDRAAQGCAVPPLPPVIASAGRAAKAALLHLLFQSLPHLDKLPRPRCSASSSSLFPLDEVPKVVLLHLFLQSLPQLDFLPKAVRINPKLMIPAQLRTQARRSGLILVDLG